MQTVAVSSGSDDAEEYEFVGLMNVDSTDLELTLEDNISRQIVGVRFASLGIPRNATILSAQIQFVTDETSTAPTNLTIAAHASDNAPAFSATDFDISSRPLTTASVVWSPAAWTTLNEAGPNQRTAELAAVLQELVGRAGWTPDSSAAFIIRGIGHRVAWAYERNPGNAPRLIVQYQEPALTVNLSTCVTPAFNPNLDGGVAPSVSDLANDCAARVQPTLSGLNGACGYPSACTCTVTPTSQRYAAACDSPCAETPLAAGCTNFDPESGDVTATNAPGDVPVCVARSPLASALFGLRSQCDVEGTATIDVEDEETKTTDASGIIEFEGSPCPGQSCAVGMSYALKLDSITYGNIFGSATFANLAAVGGTGSGNTAVLDGAGNGAFSANAIDIGARASKSGDYSKIVGTNQNTVGVGVLWAGPAPSCEVAGALVGNADPALQRCEPGGPSADATCSVDADCVDDPSCTDGICNCLPVPVTNLSLALHVSGELVNRPPTANAGPDQVVECDRAGGAGFTLASLSHDLDGNLASTRWYLGSRTGPQLGFVPRPALVQAVGASQSYVLRVIDTFSQADEDTVVVQVVDTTAPALSCNAPDTIHPGALNVSFTATAEDVCDPAATPVVTGYTCTKYGTPHPCEVVHQGSSVTIVRPGGEKTLIKWGLQVTDAAGNVSTRTCKVFVDATP